MINEFDVLCVGQSSYDLVFSVPHHPAEDEKMFANRLLHCGGGPAANAAITASRLGVKSAFAGYLGRDIFGELHIEELRENEVSTDLIVRGDLPTPISMVMVKPDGKRSLINYKGETKALASGEIDFKFVKPKVILFDGHEPHLSVSLVEYAQRNKIPTVLDAGSVHEGTLALMERVDYLVCSEKFARQIKNDEKTALEHLAKLSRCVVITLGERGLIWRRGQEAGSMPAYAVDSVDTTGAGDAFHGAFAAALSMKMSWEDTLRYSSAAGALCCMKMGARTGISSLKEHSEFLEKN
jgi:sulfofructose kinase